MESKTKNIIFIIIVAILIILCCGIGYKYNQLQKTNQLQAVELSVLQDSVKIYTSKNGELTFKINAVEIQDGISRQALKKAGFEIADLRSRNIKWRDINFALNAKLEAIGSGTITLHDTIFTNTTDTIHGSVGSWNNKYLYLYPLLVKNKLDFNYKYEVGLKVLNTKVGKKDAVSITLTDPKAVIITANSLFILPDKHWWNKWYIHTGLGLVAGYLIFK